MPSRVNRVIGIARPALALAGCAGAATAPRTVQPLAFDPASPARIGAVSVYAATGAWIKDEQRVEIRKKIQTELAQQALAPAPVPEPSSAEPPTYGLKVMLTRFDEGNAMARLALLGLGQVHIEGTVSLSDPSGHPAGQYSIRKTFAAGSILGAATSTESVESGFAKSVVSSLKPIAVDRRH